MNAGAFIIIESIVIGVLFIVWKIMLLIEWHLKYDEKPIKEKREDKWKDRWNL